MWKKFLKSSLMIIAFALIVQGGIILRQASPDDSWDLLGRADCIKPLSVICIGCLIIYLNGIGDFIPIRTDPAESVKMFVAFMFTFQTLGIIWDAKCVSFFQRASKEPLFVRRPSIDARYVTDAKSASISTFDPFYTTIKSEEYF